MADPRQNMAHMVFNILNSSMEPPSSYPLTIYDMPAGRKPSVSFAKFYYDRLIKYIIMTSQEEVFPALVLALALVVRATADSDLTITSTNVFRLFATALVISIKFLSDTAHKNSYYAKVMGTSTEELNNLEVDLLNRLDHRIQTECSLAVINQIISPTALQSLSDMTQPRMVELIVALRDCRRQQIRQKHEEQWRQRQQIRQKREEQRRQREPTK
jgi:hypothetical protein